VRAIRLLLEYDGAAFFGWQRQGGRPTVQAALEEAVRRVTGRRSPVVASGRTDAGVHAAGQVALFRTRARLPAERFRDALNAHLPPEVSVRESAEVDGRFHPMRNVVSKIYHYGIINRRARPALDRGRAWWVAAPLDVAAMRRAARRLVGRHDFRSFATEAAFRKDTVRTVRSLRLRRSGERIVVEVEGKGFLYNMVRAIAGTLVEVGRGKIKPAEVGRILAAKDRRRAGPTAPAHGLCLMSVRYR
jgi:tRNA pseudouridine38-40 synthase